MPSSIAAVGSKATMSHSDDANWSRRMLMAVRTHSPFWAQLRYSRAFDLPALPRSVLITTAAASGVAVGRVRYVFSVSTICSRRSSRVAAS